MCFALVPCKQTCFSLLFPLLLQYVEDNLGVMSVGFLLSSPDDAVIWRGPKKNGLSLLPSSDSWVCLHQGCWGGCGAWWALRCVSVVVLVLEWSLGPHAY